MSGAAMSLKQEIETWVAALAFYDNNEFDDAIAEFAKISDTSKMFFNMGIIHATLGEHEKAVECYQRAIRLDQYFAVAYFQQGVSNFLLGDFQEALANFNDTLLYLRGNTTIDYEQLGLNFKLYSCEVLFNRGMCYMYLQQPESGLEDLAFASKEKIVEDHDVIDEAMRDGAQGYTVFSIPIGVVYRPNEAKVRNLKTKDYLGKARLVAASSEHSNTYTGFAGLESKGSRADLQEEKQPQAITFTASPLVKPGLQSKRQNASDPPASRQVFPPTPPPEAERLSRGSGSGSVRATPVSRPVLAKLNILGNEAGPSRKYEKAYSPEELRSLKGSSPQDLRPDRIVSPQELNSSTSSTSNHSGNGISFANHPLRQDLALPQPNGLRRQPSAAGLGLRRGLSVKEQGWRPSQPIEEAQEIQPEPLRLVGGSLRQGRPLHQQQHRQQPPPPPYPQRNDYDVNAHQNYEEEDVHGPLEGAMYEDELEHRRQMHSRSQSRSHSRSNSCVPRASSRRPEIRQVRVKVHAQEVRYLMIGTSTSFDDFVERIREKMGLRGTLKIKVRDEDEPSDMITMGDQDDLDMAIESATSRARTDRTEAGKMEVWVFEV